MLIDVDNFNPLVELSLVDVDVDEHDYEVSDISETIPNRRAMCVFEI